MKNLLRELNALLMATGTPVCELDTLSFEEMFKLLDENIAEIKEQFNCLQKENENEIREQIKKQIMEMKEKEIDEEIDNLFKRCRNNNIDLNNLIKAKVELKNNTDINLAIHIIETGNKENGFTNKIEILTEEDAYNKGCFSFEEGRYTSTLKPKEMTLDLEFKNNM